jgi:hypothetical protein
VTPDLSRRGFLTLSAGVAAALGLTGAVTAQQATNTYDHPAFLLGPARERPAPDGQFFAEWDEYRFVYLETDTGRRAAIETDDTSWTPLPVETDDLTIADTVTDPAGNTLQGGALFLLRHTGYTAGDPLAAPTYQAYQRSTAQATTSYSALDPSFFRHQHRHDRHAPGALQWTLQAEVVPPSGEDAAIRLRNTTDAETIVEQTGISSQTTIAPVASYEPTTTGAPVTLAVETRTSGGLTLTVRDLSVQPGISL